MFVDYNDVSNQAIIEESKNKKKQLNKIVLLFFKLEVCEIIIILGNN